MLKRAWKTLLITSIVTLLPIPVGLVLWDRLPDVMATHFGTNNEANGFSSKPFAVFFIPLFCLAMLWICAVITANDPRKKNISPKIFNLVLWIIPIVSLICGAAIYTYNLGHPLDISSFMMILMGILFILIGNYMPKTRQNYTIGHTVFSRSYQSASFDRCGSVLYTCTDNLFLVAARRKGTLNIPKKQSSGGPAALSPLRARVRRKANYSISRAVS